MMRVADCYGSIPYSKVRDGQMYVAYDKEEEVYKHIMDDLKYAVGILGSFGNKENLLLGRTIYMTVIMPNGQNLAIHLL